MAKTCIFLKDPGTDPDPGGQLITDLPDPDPGVQLYLNLLHGGEHVQVVRPHQVVQVP
jgi:hypothetical protein